MLELFHVDMRYAESTNQCSYKDAMKNAGGFSVRRKGSDWTFVQETVYQGAETQFLLR